MLIALLNPSIGFGWLQTREGQLQADSYDMSLPAETETYYYHTDHLGTPKAMTDENQQIAWRADYTPFGMANITTGQASNNLRFPGQYFDQETGLHYNYFRYYDPTTGRYITSDPIGLGGGLNTFVYAHANPINYIDPLGLNSWNEYQRNNPGRTPSENRVRYRQDQLNKLGAGKAKGGVGNILSPPSIVWETPASEGCFIGWIYKYVWNCKNYYPPDPPMMCTENTGAPEYSEVITSCYRPPRSGCYLEGIIPDKFGWSCPRCTSADFIPEIWSVP